MCVSTYYQMLALNVVHHFWLLPFDHLYGFMYVGPRLHLGALMNPGLSYSIQNRNTTFKQHQIWRNLPGPYRWSRLGLGFGGGRSVIYRFFFAPECLAGVTSASCCKTRFRGMHKYQAIRKWLL